MLYPNRKAGPRWPLFPSPLPLPLPLPLLGLLQVLLPWSLLGLAGCGDAVAPPPDPMPAPTDPREGAAGEDEDHHAEREAWIEEMHRAADGVDWREVELGNQRRELLRRNAEVAAGLASGAGPGARRSVSPWYWEEVGSRNQAGHTRCAALGPERGGERFLYVGSAAGGVWRGSMDGQGWTPLSDAVYGGVDDLAIITPSNLLQDDIVVMRRGDRVLRSADSGQTWTEPTGLQSLRSGRRMVKAVDWVQTIYLFGTADIPGQGERSALFASIDGGQSFQLRYSFVLRWPGDVWVPRTAALGGSAVYVLQAGRIYVSTDDGFSFGPALVLDAGASSGDLVGSEAGGPTLFAALRVGDRYELHRSNDGGVSASYIRELDGLWSGTTALAALSTDPQHLLYSGVECRRSVDGGASGVSINAWGAYYGNPAARLHADIRGISPLVVSDATGERDLIYINTDGGTYVTENGGMTVRNLSLRGLGVGQFYSTHTSVLDPGRISGGTQDQGYQVGQLAPPLLSGPSTNFVQTISGDYGHLTSGDGTHGLVYSTYPGFTLVQVGETNPQMRQVSFPSGVDRLWLPPVVADPDDANSFFFLGSELHRYQRSGSAWNGARWSNHDFGAGNNTYLTAMAFAPSDSSRGYAITDAGNIFVSDDRGVTWARTATGGPGSHYFYGAAILVDPADRDHLFVAGSGYSTAGVRESVDGGTTWLPRAVGLPSTLVHDIAWSPNGSGDIFAATEAGAYHYDALSQAWSNAMGLEGPSTNYWSVETVEASQRVRFGTHGRGIWDVQLLDGTSAVSTAYCGPAIANHTGVSATIRAIGSPLIADNDLTLVAESLPPSTFGFFLTSRETGLIFGPGGANGVLCLGGAIGRYVTNVLSSGPAGEFQLSADLTAMPQPTGAVPAFAGQQWHFQAWYRDLLFGVPTSNFTDGATVLLR